MALTGIVILAATATANDFDSRYWVGGEIAWPRCTRPEFARLPGPGVELFTLSADQFKIWAEAKTREHKQAIAGVDRAIADDTRAISINPGNALAYNARATAYCQKNDRDRAIADFTQAIQIDPLPNGDTHINVYVNRGNAYSDMGNSAAAIADYTQAIAIDPKNVLAYLGRGTTYYSLSDSYVAHVEYLRNILRHPGYRATLRMESQWPYSNDAGNAAAANDDTERAAIEKVTTENTEAIDDFDRTVGLAIADYTEAIQIDPSPKDSHINIYFNRGAAYTSRGDAERSLADYDRAIADFGQAITIDPTNAAIYYSRGHAYEGKEDYEHAIADFSEAIRLHQTPKYLNKRCWVRAIAGRELESALDDCNQSIRLMPDGPYFPRALNPNLHHVLNSRAMVQLKLGNYERAIADYGALVGLFAAQDADSLYGRGVARVKSGNAVISGNADIAAAKAINPDIADVYAGYGVVLD